MVDPGSEESEGDSEKSEGDGEGGLDGSNGGESGSSLMLDCDSDSKNSCLTDSVSDGSGFGCSVGKVPGIAKDAREVKEDESDYSSSLRKDSCS